MRTFLNTGISIFLLNALLFFSSCGKEEKNVEDTNSLSKLDYKTEFVEVKAKDWDKISNQYYQISLESDIIKTYKSVKYIRVYKKLNQPAYGAEGFWKELPFDNYSFEYINDKINLHCYNCNLDTNAMFKLEIKVDGSINTYDYAEVQKSTIDKYLNVFNDFVQTKHNVEKGFQSIISL